MTPGVYVDCPVCKGTALTKKDWCGNCGGSGIVHLPFPNFKNGERTLEETRP